MDFPKIFSRLIFFKYTRTVFSLFFIYENLKGSIWRNNFCRLLLSGTAIDRIEIEGKTLYAATAIKCQVFANFQKKKIFVSNSKGFMTTATIRRYHKEIYDKWKNFYLWEVFPHTRSSRPKLLMKNFLQKFY